MKKAWNLFFKLVFIILLLIGIGIVFLSQTVLRVNGVLYTGLDISYDYIRPNVEEANRVFTDENLNSYVTYDIDFSPIANRTIFQKLSDFATEKNYILDCDVSFDKDGLRSYLQDLNKMAIKSEDAYIALEDTYYIVPEVYGTEIDIDTFISNLGVASDMKVSDYYIQPNVYVSDKMDLLRELEKFTTWSVTYSNGEVLRSSTEYVVLNEDESISLDDSFIEMGYKEILDSYDTVGAERTFHTSMGEKIQLRGGTWGSLVNYDEELGLLKRLFQSGVSLQERVPEFERYYEEIGGSFVEVSIPAQHVWLYIDDVLVAEADCVTGSLAANHGTPTGIYYISERINGKYLIGDDYKTWVNKWMRLTNTGIGLHDAYWRGSFGGSIYKTNGSHGCINLPPSFASKLFDCSYVGMPVIVY